MTFHFSRQGLSRQARILERLFEILPGATSWSLLLGMGLLSFADPLLAAMAVIAFDLYWLLRLFYLTFFLVLSYLRLSVERDTNWMERAQGVGRLRQYLEEPQRVAPLSNLGEHLSLWVHGRELAALQHSDTPPPPLAAIYHLVIFPIVNEGPEVLGPGIESLTRQPFPASRMLVVFALEARAPDHVKAGIRGMQAEYHGAFLDVLVVEHPDGLPGEARVKGANATYAAKAAARYLADRNIPFEHVIASCFDADTVVSPDYFGCLTYAFMVTPNRTRASFQPIPVYHNNIWEAPAFARVLDIGASLFQLVEATDPDKLVTFSSHSMSFKALVEVGYWPVDLISDDSAIFWKAFIHFDGDYRTIPLYVTVSMDVANAGSFWKTMVNVYKQKRRWAWGVENFPIVMRAFLASKRLSVYDKVRHGFKLFEAHVAWATWPLLLTVISWLPALCAGREFSSSVVYYSAPRITSIIFSLASLSLAVTVILSQYLLPKRPGRSTLLTSISQMMEWVSLPVVSTFLSAVPALDAQTRLLCGKYMEFWVTDKTHGRRRPALRRGRS